jgi:DNA polymerase III delta prime subunit
MNQSARGVAVKNIKSIGIHNVVDLNVYKNSNFVTDGGVVVHNCNSTQPALRNFMEEFSKNCGFILTCNYKNRIIKPLHSRCSVIEFSIPKDCKPKLAAQFMKRVEAILDKEGIRYERQAVVAVIQKFFPDWRRVLNELQRYSATGAIDSGILTNFEDLTVRQVIEACKKKDFDGIRKWVHDNSDQEQMNVFRSVYDAAFESIDKKSIPELVVIIADYQYKAAFIADHEINLVAFFAEIMMRCEFK